MISMEVITVNIGGINLFVSPFVALQDLTHGGLADLNAVVIVNKPAHLV